LQLDRCPFDSDPNEASTERGVDGARASTERDGDGGVRTDVEG
jgi:hypothetical protein